MDQPIDDNVLIQAVRQRMLDEIRAKREAAAVINNNVYGGGGSDSSPSIMAGMHDAAPNSAADDRDYLVDIIRENTPNGWKKTVHRHTEPKSKKKVTPKAPQEDPRARKMQDY